jgi:hypothetical protein
LVHGHQTLVLRWIRRSNRGRTVCAIDVADEYQRGPHGMNLKYQQYKPLAPDTGAQKGVPPSRCARNIEGPCPQLPPSIVSHDSALLLCLGLEVRGHVCARRGPWSVEYLGLDPLIFSGLGRRSFMGDARATHEQSHVPCLCPSGEYRSLASLGYRNHLTRASSPCQVSKGRVVAPSDPPNQGAFPLIIPFCGLVAH